jgi:DNA-binding LacI/PurR family transcriptional regulator
VAGGAPELFDRISKLARKWIENDTVPETLIVADDMAMRTVALVLLKEGISIPDDMLVISQANEGINIFYGIPVVKYVFPSLEMSNMAVNILEDRMRVEKIDEQVPVMVQGAFEG